MSIRVEQVPCAGTVATTVPVVTTPYITSSAGAGALSVDDNAEEVGPQYLADRNGTELDMVVPPTTTPNSSTWLTSPDQVVITTPYL